MYQHSMVCPMQLHCLVKPLVIKQEVKTEPKDAADSEEDWEDAAAATPKPSLVCFVA